MNFYMNILQQIEPARVREPDLDPKYELSVRQAERRYEQATKETDRVIAEIFATTPRH